MKKSIFIISGILLMVCAGVFTLIIMRQCNLGRLNEKRLNQVILGMSRTEVENLIGKPAEKIGLDERGLVIGNYVYYSYLLESEDVLWFYFREGFGLYQIDVDRMSGNPMVLLDSSMDSFESKLVVDLEKGQYYHTKPAYFVANDRSRITSDVINEIKLGMGVETASRLFGHPDEKPYSGTFVYILEKDMKLWLEFNDGLLTQTGLWDDRNQTIFSGFFEETNDPRGTKLCYDPLTGFFSKEYPPVDSEILIHPITPEQLNQVHIGMSKEDTIALFGAASSELTSLPQDILILEYDVGSDCTFSFAFKKSLYEVKLRIGPSDKPYTVFILLSSRDPEDTRVRYDLKSGLFTKEMPE